MPFVVVVTVLAAGCAGAQMKQDPQKLEQLCADPANAEKDICKYLEGRVPRKELEKALAQMAKAKGCRKVYAAAPWQCASELKYMKRVAQLEDEVEILENQK